jgi:hypothetical protein
VSSAELTLTLARLSELWNGRYTTTPYNNMGTEDKGEERRERGG